MVTPVRPAAGGRRARRLRPRRRAARRDRRRPRRAARACAAVGGPAASAVSPGLEHQRSGFLAMVERAKDYIRAGDIFQVVLSQRFSAPFDLPPFRSIARCGASIRRRSSCYLDFGDLPDRLLEPGNPGARARRQGHHPPDRRHPLARRDDRDEDEALAARAARRPEGARRASDAARSRPQRRRPRRRDRHGRGDRAVCDRALQPRHAHRLATSKASSTPSTT